VGHSTGGAGFSGQQWWDGAAAADIDAQDWMGFSKSNPIIKIANPNFAPALMVSYGALCTPAATRRSPLS
jgi:hypothetical protein